MIPPPARRITMRGKRPHIATEVKLSFCRSCPYKGPTVAMTAPSLRHTLLTRNLVAYLGSRVCSGTGMTMLRAAIAWHVFTLTNSAFHLGLIGLVQFLPA